MKPAWKKLRNSRGFSMAEVMVATGVSAMIAAGLIAGMIALQRSFSATDDYAVWQEDQLRILDYLALDLRRAWRATPLDQLPSNIICEIFVPDYYASNDPASPEYRTRRNPQYRPGGGVMYGGPNDEVRIRYLMIGNEIFREEAGTRSPTQSVARDVAEFEIEFPEQIIDRVVRIEIRFQPGFRRNPDRESMDATTAQATVMMRNLMP